MKQIVLKLVTILLVVVVCSTENTTLKKLVDTIKMSDIEMDIVLPGYQPTNWFENVKALIARLKRPKCMTVRELLIAHLAGCFIANRGCQPVGIRLACNPVTNEPGEMALTRMTLNMSSIFRDMALWTIITEEHPIGMLYISGNVNDTDFQNMLSIEDLDDAIGLATLPGYKMINKRHLSSLDSIMKFLKLALDNVWSQKLHFENHLALWDNIFRIIIEEDSKESFKPPTNHEATCSCYRMVPRVLAMCGHGISCSKEEAGCTDECSIGYLCPVLFRLLPIFGIKSVHIEKNIIFYDVTLSYAIADAKIERLSFEDGSYYSFSNTSKLLDSLINEGTDSHCFWNCLKILKAPGWYVTSSQFIEIVTNLKQLENIVSVKVGIGYIHGEAEALFLNPRAGRLLSKCIIFWDSNGAGLSSLSEEMREAIRNAKIEHLSFKYGSEVDVLIKNSDIWQNLRAFSYMGKWTYPTPNSVMKLVESISSLKNFKCTDLGAEYDGKLMEGSVCKLPKNILTVSELIIGFASLTIPELFLERLLETLTDELSCLTISCRPMRSLHAPKIAPAFANRFKKLDIHDLNYLSTDMCSYLGTIGGSVEELILRQTEYGYSDILGCKERGQLAALVGTAGKATPLGRSVTSVFLSCVASESLDLRPLLCCDKLVTITFHLSGSTGGKMQVGEEAILKAATELTKFKRKRNGPKFRLRLSCFDTDDLIKLINRICSGSNPARVIEHLCVPDYRFSGTVEKFKSELKRRRRPV